MKGLLSRRAAISLPPLPRRFYQRDTTVVARELLGKVLFCRHLGEVVALRLTEVEAYLGTGDPACHTFGGRRTPRTEVMWGDGGHLYVYFTYGMHYCANVVTRRAGEPEAVLLRAGEPVLGAELMRERRRGRTPRPLAQGPAMLCQALGIDRSLNGANLARRERVWIADDGVRWPEGEVFRRPRVGVAYAGEAARWPLRFLVNVAGPGDVLAAHDRRGGRAAAARRGSSRGRSGEEP
jgi:DNA-3-methyladenine glycosylase